jgi:hypothetical protein
MTVPWPPGDRFPGHRNAGPIHVRTSDGVISRPLELAPAMHTTLVATDIVGFGKKYRDADAQMHVRRMMYELFIEAFTITGLPWWDCHREDRGDGALVVAPPDVHPDSFLDPLAHHLNATVHRYNRHASDNTQLHLRMAVHHGYVYRDTYGVTGDALTHLFRLLEAPAFKKSLATVEADLGVIVSHRLYTDARQRGGLINPAGYAPLHLSYKETRTRAWLWLPAGSDARR